MASKKIYTDSALGQVTIRKNRLAKRMSIRVSARNGIAVTIPYWMPFKAGEVFLATKRDWAMKALAGIEERIREDLAAVTPETIEQWRKTAKETLPPRLQELAHKYGFSYNRVTIKHNRSNWGSCSRLGNINLNLNIVRLPSDVRDYILLHELCHLRHMDHGREFHELLENLCRKEFGEGNGKEQVHLIKRKALKQYTLY